MLFAATSTPAPAQQLGPVESFFANYGLLLLLLALIIFMFWSSRRRNARMKVEQEAKQRAMVPGVKVLLQGGLYGTLVEFDSEDLSKPATVELAPGVPIEVHSQAILRVVEDEQLTEDDFIESEVEQAEYAADVADGEITSISDDAAQKAVDATDVTPDSDDKPKA